MTVAAVEDVQRVRGARRLRGTIRVPGDKSISHRALLFNALAAGTARVRGFLDGADCRTTLAALRAMGVRIEETGGTLTVHGAGLHGLTEPADILDCGNSGTTTRLLLGILAGQPFFTALTGDGSLRRRPMARVTDPLRQMGARIDGREGGKLLPLGVRGGNLHGIYLCVARRLRAGEIVAAARRALRGQPDDARGPHRLPRSHRADAARDGRGP